MKCIIINLLLISFLLSVQVFPQDKITSELNTLVEKLSEIEHSIEKQSFQKRSAILNDRNAPYAILYEHTGLFEWQLIHQCYYDWDVDTTTVVDVDVDYKPNEDYFSIIPAYFYFYSKRPYSSLNDYKNMMINVFQAVATNVTVLKDEADTKYGYTGHHYCHSFYFSGTKMVLDCYFVYVDNVACAIYYMTGDYFYDHFLYQIFFDLVLDVLKFKSSTGASEQNNNIPVKLNLSQNYPNPFNSETTIKYSVSIPSNVKLEIFNSQGRLIKTLINSYHTTGEYRINYNANELASGIYVYRISNLNNYISHSMLMIK